MRPRFYAPDLDPDLPLVTLPPDEAWHLTKVLRLGAGDEVSIFDGRGAEYRAVVEAAVRETASLRLAGPLPAAPAPAVRIVLVQSVLKGSSMDDAVRDATMMGVEAIEPVLTAHTDVKPSVARRPATVGRWRRVALAAVKQCRRARLPIVHEPRRLDEWIATPSGAMKLLFVEPSIAGVPRPLKSLLQHRVPARVAVLLGPEGGWAGAEIDAALRAGCIPVSLGPLTLRAESMPVAALAALAALWEA
jgi:16S rRNA (uracil1498-N3)-methyltransferase